ncbi:MAG: CDP-alcohol phosphatidyltransferase family protein [Actinobacteria bacterium]|nr:CDP-alcohol phosphatidyltransferase family protein [Actinomycetota bacterium]
MEYQEFSDLWSREHGNVSTRGVVGVWLRISYRLAKICTAGRISPNGLTALGVVSAIGTAVLSPHWSIAFLLLISLLCDGIDGSTAIVQNRTSKLGAVLDSVADRVSESFWAIAFYRLGAPLTWIVALWMIATIQEYSRARLGSEGMREIGVVTLAERPVRAIAFLVAIILAQFHATSEWVNGVAIFLTSLQVFSFGQILIFARKSLK